VRRAQISREYNGKANPVRSANINLQIYSGSPVHRYERRSELETQVDP